VTALRPQNSHSAQLVLTWPAGKSDKDAMIRVQNRRLAIIEAKEGWEKLNCILDSETEPSSATTKSTLSSSDSALGLTGPRPIWYFETR